MDIVLWIAQGLLALAFLASGSAKLKDDHTTFAASRPPGTSFAADLSEPTFTSIGALEVLGAIGVVLPWALDIAPVLTPIAAAGLAVIMAGAALTHVRRGERQPIVANVILLALALTVAIGRGVELAG
jgi:uncharacterized membrane protein YphA (DoxX/SURF4 family)